MRKLSYLLTVVRDLLPENIEYCGMCYVIRLLYYSDLISHDEWKAILCYLDDNKPKEQYDNFYWWKPGEIQPRIEWLNEHIDKLKSEGL